MTTQTAQEHRIAAERAAEATRWDEAAREYEAALSLIAAGDGAGEDEAALLTALGSCYWNLAEARTAWRTLRRAIALCRDRGDGTGVARATAEILRIWGPPERQRTMAEEALAALGDGDPYLRAQLLLRGHRWDGEGADEAFAEAMALADRHGFEDLRTIRTDRAGWAAFDAGRIDEGVAKMEAAHETYARLRRYEPAAGVLRGAAFATMAQGHLDRGAALAERTVAYSTSVHLRFTEQLALMDLAGEAFARGEFDRCRTVLARSPGDQDFRGDLYQMWMIEQSGDIQNALRMLVNPARGGGATTALSQTHCANAGVLFHAGNEAAARQELQSWAEVARQGQSFFEEAPAIFDCLVALGDDALVGEVHAALQRDAERPAPTVFCPLQGRALAPARGAIAARLGHLDEAERTYRDGLAWCERERVPVDEAHCLIGLHDIAAARGDAAGAAGHLDRAAVVLEEQGARLWLDRLIAPQRQATS